MTNLNPEQRARVQIDAMLNASGWIAQDYRSADFTAGRGIALREVPLTTGPCDYLLLVDRMSIGVVEAKKVGTTLSTVADQSARYAPFSQRGGLGRAHQLFGEMLPTLLHELNEVLAA